MKARLSPPRVPRGWLIAWRAGSDVLAKAAMFAVTIGAARQLSPTAFGVFSIASTLGWMLAVVSDFGMQLHVARCVAQSPEHAGALASRWWHIRLLTAGAGLLAAGILAASVDASTADRAAVVLLGASYLLGALTEFAFYVCRGLGRTDLESAIVVFQRTTLVVTAGVVLWWHPTLLALAIAMAIPNALALGAAGWSTVRLIRSPRAEAETVAGAPAGGQFLRDVAPLGLAIVLSAAYFRVDLFLVGLWLGTETAGTYNAVFRLVEALRLVPAAVLAVVLPLLFTAEDGRPLVGTAVSLTVFGALVALAGWMTAPWLVPLLYGDRFTAAVPAFQVLLLCFPLFSLNYALTHQLVGWHGQHRYLLISATALAANLAMNAVWIPAHGLIGAAWATWCTEVLLTSGCALALRGLQRQMPRLPEPVVAVAS